MLKDGFKASYTTIPFAKYRKRYTSYECSFVAHHHKEVELIAMLDGKAEFTKPCGATSSISAERNKTVKQKLPNAPARGGRPFEIRSRP